MIDLVVVVLLLAFLTWYGHREPSENKTVQLAKPDRNDNHVKPVIEPTSAQTKNDTNTSEDISDVQNIDKPPLSTNGIINNNRNGFHSNYPAADVVTFVGPMLFGRAHICGAIFKNPDDKCTHFYRYRLKGSEDGCPLEIRNIGAAIKLWGRHWENISNVKIFEAKASEIEEPSMWLSRLEDQQEDCQNKYGCRISLEDFDYINSVEKKVFKDLTRKILESCMSEDDLIYFSGMDDSSIMDKNYFDI